MKKVIFTAAVALSLAACSQQSDFDVKLPENASKTISVNRSSDEAILIANQVLSAGDIASRGGSYQKRATNVHAVLGDQSRSGSADTLLYAVDVEDNGGFILVAAPKSAEPIMAIIDEGSFCDPENFNNEPYQETLDQIKNYVASKNKIILEIDTTKVPLIPFFYRDTIDIRRTHEPAIKVAWNQKWPENIYTPNKVAGCVPVAIAQMLSAFEVPASINYTYPNHDIPNEFLNWSEIKKHKHSYIYDNFCLECYTTASSHNTLARIIRQLGYLANADYSDPEATKVDRGKYIEDIIYNLTSKRPYSKHQSLANLFSFINNNGGAAIVDFLFKNDSHIAHAFIADGTQYVNYQILRYEMGNGGYEPVVEKEILTELIHYNWGWAGNCNGWFNLSSVTPMNAVEYDYPDEVNFTTNDFSKESIIYWYYKF